MRRKQGTTSQGPIHPTYHLTFAQLEATEYCPAKGFYKYPFFCSTVAFASTRLLHVASSSSCSTIR